MTFRAVWHAAPNLRVLVNPQPWTLEPVYQDAVDAFWDLVVLEEPQFFRGPVLSVTGVKEHMDGVTLYTRWTDYAHFLYSHRYWPADHPGYVRVLFAAACLITRDGQLLVAEMGDKTVRPGWIQAVGGSAEPSDVADGIFDPVRSIRHEVEEETGLDLSNCEIVRSIDVVGFTEDLRDGSVAVAVKVPLWLTQEEARQRFLSRPIGPDRELSDLLALPLGKTGSEALKALGRPTVRYLDALLQAPDLV